MFNDRLNELLEDSVHVRALSRPQALKETNMATVTGDEQGQVGILLDRLHWNGCKGYKGFRSCVSCIHPTIILKNKAVQSCCTEKLVRLPGLTMRRGKDIISSVQAQHWHLHRFQPVDRTGIVVVVIIGRIAKHYGGEPLVKFPNGPCL